MAAFNRNRTRLLMSCSLAPVLMAACCATTAAAQSGGAGAEAEVEAVVVTASRIDRAGFEAPTPTVHITSEELSIGARPNVAAALNDMPQFRATTSPQTTGTNTGAGNAPLDLRGLGISRTLVLVDGRRLVGDNDLNAVPTVLIKGVDVVTGGASAAWGSGAVAGVANITMDREFTGVKLGGEYGLSSRSDGEQFRFEGAFGETFADGRGHIVVGGEFLDNEGIVPKVSRKNIGRWAQVSNGAGAFINVGDVGFSDAAYGGLIMSGVLKGKAFNPDGSLRDFNYGKVVGTSMIGGEGPSNDDLSPLVTPQRRYSGMIGVTYDVNDKLKITADLAALADVERLHLVRGPQPRQPDHQERQRLPSGRGADGHGGSRPDHLHHGSVQLRPVLFPDRLRAGEHPGHAGTRRRVRRELALERLLQLRRVRE